jgi:transposase InsO family protein
VCLNYAQCRWAKALYKPNDEINSDTLLAQAGITVSMSGKGNCYDNAMMESFISSFKTEGIHRQSFERRSEVKQVIFEWIEVFSNRQRRHSSLGYVSPIRYEQQLMSPPSSLTPQK